MSTLANPDGKKLDYVTSDRTHGARAMSFTSNATIAVEDVSTEALLNGLARLHPLVLVTDLEGRVIWMSDELAVLRGGIEQHGGHPLCQALSSLPGARQLAKFTEQISQIQKHLEHHDTLDDVRLDLGAQGGVQRSIDLRAFKVGARGERRLVVTIIEPTGLTARAERAEHTVLDSILGSSPDAVFLLSESGGVCYANPAVESVLGLDPQHMCGQALSHSLAESTDLARAIDAACSSMVQDESEIRHELPDGRERWVTVTALPQPDRPECVVIARDVTRQVVERRQLERQNAELESYVHSVSHDLRSPLVSLLGFTRLLRQDYEHLFDESGRHFAERIEQSARTMQALIEDLLELSRIGASSEQRTLVDPRSVLIQLQAELKLRLEERSATLLIPDNPPLVLCDRTRLYQLFSNLVGNSIEHMGDVEDRRIEVSILSRDSDHVITVADHGVGIHPEDQERIFEVFQTRSPAAHTKATSGIGLAIVKRIAEAHGGQAWVESEPGQGARFRISLPRSI
jgi:PAS domain S-box-containing protein